MGSDTLGLHAIDFAVDGWELTRRKGSGPGEFIVLGRGQK